MLRFGLRRPLMIRVAVALLALAFAASAARANDLARDLGADRHTARDLYRDQSGAGFRRSGDQRGARAGGRASRAELAKRAGVPFAITGAQRRAGRDRQREERRRPTSASWRSIRCAPRQVDFSQNYALAQNTYWCRRAHRSDRSRMRIAPACASASARAMPATISSPARSSTPSSERNEGGIVDAA